VIARKRHGLLVVASLIVGASALVGAAAPSSAVPDTLPTSHCAAAGVGASAFTEHKPSSHPEFNKPTLMRLVNNTSQPVYVAEVHDQEHRVGEPRRTAPGETFHGSPNDRLATSFHVWLHGDQLSGPPTARMTAVSPTVPDEQAHCDVLRPFVQMTVDGRTVMEADALKCGDHTIADGIDQKTGRGTMTFIHRVDANPHEDIGNKEFVWSLVR
jgi:hypothetical protein